MKHVLALILALVAFPANAGQWDTLSDVSAWLPQPDACAVLDANSSNWWTPCVNRQPDPNAPFQQLPGNILGGRMDATPGIPDFMLSAESRFWGDDNVMGSDGWPKLYSRSLVMTDYDTPDLVLRRVYSTYGEDGSHYDADPSALRAVPAGKCLGKLYWQALGNNAYGGLGFYAGKVTEGGFGRNAGIEACAVGNQTATSRGGEMYFYTTPSGNPGNMVRRMRLESDGTLRLISNGNWSGSYGGIKPDGVYGTAFDIYSPNGNHTQFGGAITWPDNPGDTSMVLVIRTGSSTFETRKVSYGAANSCGSGKRCLVVDN